MNVKFRAQWHIAVAMALTLMDVDKHAFAIDVLLPCAESCSWLPETRLGLGGLTTTEVSLSWAGFPVPCGVKVWGLPEALSSMATAAERMPALDGWNTIAIWQFHPVAGLVPEQVLDRPTAGRSRFRQGRAGRSDDLVPDRQSGGGELHGWSNSLCC